MSPTFLDVLPACADCLYDYQRRQLQELRAVIAGGVRRVLVQLPTGGGKTHEIAAIVACALAVDLRVLILATRTRICWQIHERLEAFQIPHGVIAAALPDLNWRAGAIQIASVDTLYRRSIVDERLPLPDADALIFDEAHLALGESRIALLDRYPQALHLGLTATPAKISGRSLRERFDALLLGPTVKELVALGRLVPTRIFSAPVITTSELAAIAKDAKTGDYAPGELGASMSRPKLVGDVVSNWLRIANGKRTLCFACNKAHGAALLAEFLQAGIAAELLTDQDSEPDREAAIYRLETGATKIIVNCFLLSYGTDIPSVECIVLARPTRSVVLYLQTTGRGMRPHPGKDHVILIDHGRVVENLGMPDEDFGWSLDDRTNVNRAASAAAKRRMHSAENPRTCPECSHIWLVSEEGHACSCCGWVPVPPAKQVSTLECELIEMRTAPMNGDVGEIEMFFRQALGDAQRREPQKWRERPNTVRSAMWYKTCEKFKLPTPTYPFPKGIWKLSSLPPSAAVAGWLHSQRIAYRKRRERESCT